MLRGTEKGDFSPMTLFAWLAIGVGVGAMSSLLSVMYGFEGALKARVLNAYPHLMIKSKSALSPIAGFEPWTEKLKAVKGVKRVMPYAETEMILEKKLLRRERAELAKKFKVLPMTKEEACFQLELLDHEFYVFLNEENENVCVIYKRKDGDYGLIEPEM